MTSLILRFLGSFLYSSSMCGAFFARRHLVRQLNKTSMTTPEVLRPARKSPLGDRVRQKFDSVGFSLLHFYKGDKEIFATVRWFLWRRFLYTWRLDKRGDKNCWRNVRVRSGSFVLLVKPRLSIAGGVVGRFEDSVRKRTAFLSQELI